MWISEPDIEWQYFIVIIIIITHMFNSECFRSYAFPDHYNIFILKLEVLLW